MKRAVIYLRVSTDEQVKGYSLDNQRDKCIAKAKELGCDDTVIFSEEGVSGEIMTRPALMDAISVVHSDKYASYFICTDPDRLSRNSTNLLVLTEQIERNAELVFIDFNRESTPEGNLFYTVRGAIAQFEKELIRRRTMTGKIRAAHEGKFPHWPDIYGYDYNSGVVTINEHEAKVVKLIFQYGAEMGVNSIANRLSEMNVLSPRAKKTSWSNTTIRRIIQNETYYTGKVTVRKYNTEKTHLNRYIDDPDEKHKRSLRPREEWVELAVPTIISEDEFIMAKRRMVNARRRFDGITKHSYLLSGLIRCGHCGSTWHGITPTRGNHAYYVCTLRSPGPRKGSTDERCSAGFIHCDIIDSIVWEMVDEFLHSDESIHEFNRKRVNQTQKTNLTELDVLREREIELSREEDLLIERLTKESSTRLRAKLDERLDAVSKHLDQVQSQIRELTVGQSETASTIDVGLIRDVRREIPDIDNISRQEKYNAIHRIVREIRVTLGDNKEIRVEITPIN